MTRPVSHRSITLKGASGNDLVGEVYGDHGPPVLLLHGGGQTRHAWRKTGDTIARTGRVAYAIDQRGHGDSEHAALYGWDADIRDAITVMSSITSDVGIMPSHARRISWSNRKRGSVQRIQM